MLWLLECIVCQQNHAIVAEEHLDGAATILIVSEDPYFSSVVIDVAERRSDGLGNGTTPVVCILMRPDMRNTGILPH